VLSFPQMTSVASLEKKKETIVELAKQIGVHESILACPQGYDSSVGVRGVHLSGGQRQKISLLRFSMRARLCSYCFLDEPTHSIDIESERILIRTLFSICKGKTTVIVTHRPSILEHCDRVVLLDQGKIVKSSIKESLYPPDEIREVHV